MTTRRIFLGGVLSLAPASAAVAAPAPSTVPIPFFSPVRREDGTYDWEQLSVNLDGTLVASAASHAQDRQ